MLDVTQPEGMLSDRPSFEWVCNVTGRPILFRPLKLTFSTCFCVVVAHQWHGRDVVWRFGKRTVGGAQDGRLDVTLLRKSQGLVKKLLFYAGCVHFTVDWLFLNIYDSYIDPRPLLSRKKTGHFSFDNMGNLIYVFLCIYLCYSHNLYIFFFQVCSCPGTETEWSNIK